jgi:hypothetical protein
VVAQALAMLRERDGVADRLAVRAVHHGHRLVENGKAQGEPSLRVAWSRNSSPHAANFAI